MACRDAVVSANSGSERALGSQVRSLGSRIARVLFCAHKGEMVLLHDFIKKTRKTQQVELDLAVKRMKELK